MPLLKGKSPMWFLIGIPFLVGGALLYAKSEQLAGWNNVEKGKALELWGGIIFALGIVCWVIMFSYGFKRKSQ